VGNAAPVVHLTNVPFYPDNTDQCGPASLASILNFWGKNVTPAQLKSEVYIHRLRGSLPMDMPPALEANGLRAQIISGSFEIVKAELRAGRPMIAYLDFGTRKHPIGHYLVITGFDDQRRGLYVHSSMHKDKFASYRRFNRGWSDTDHWLLLASTAPATGVEFSTAAIHIDSKNTGASHRAPRFKPSLSAKEYMELGTIYASQAKQADALAQYKLALSVDSRYAPALTALGNAAYGAKDFKQAERYFERALKSNPTDPAANNNLAMAYVAQNKKLPRAEELANKALSSDLKPYAYDTLARIYLKQGDEVRAKQAWENAVAAAGGNTDLIRAINDDANELIASER
jgi:tetratricopeptide (TPR) repeat protein